MRRYKTKIFSELFFEESTFALLPTRPSDTLVDNIQVQTHKSRRVVSFPKALLQRRSRVYLLLLTSRNCDRTSEDSNLLLDFFGVPKPTLRKAPKRPGIESRINLLMPALNPRQRLDHRVKSAIRFRRRRDHRAH